MTVPEASGKRPKIHVVYEYGIDYRPHSSSYLRLIRPLTHPLVREQLDTTFSLDYYGEPADLVIVDRLWRPDVTLQSVQELVNRIHLHGAKFAFCLDDNFFDLARENKGYPPEEFLPIVAYMLKQADRVVVSTSSLKQRLEEYNPNILVLSNQLDERLLVIRNPSDARRLIDPERIVIGYMGTFTHDEDLLMVLPALKAVHQRFPGRIELQVIGVIRKEDTKKFLNELSVRYIYPRPEEHEYPLFMPWFTGHVNWDIALSPLCDTPFTRCKSDIKFLDYAAIGAAGIFSRSPAYLPAVQQKENGWIVDNTPEAWEEAIETLILDRPFRYKIASNAFSYLYRERILARHALDWVKIVQS